MKDKCLEIGIIQAFVDGELESSVLKNVTRHIADCGVCAFLVEDLETENEIAFGALDTELNVLVPTERLRQKVFTSIDEIEAAGRTGIWGQLVGALGITGLFARPGIAAFASLALIVGITAIGFKYYSTEDGASNVVAGNTLPDSGISSPQIATDSNDGDGDNVIKSVGTAEKSVESNEIRKIDPVRAPIIAQKVSSKVKTVRNIKRSTFPVAPVANNIAGTPPVVVQNTNIASEDGYLTTIATLSRTVDESKDYVLRPSERVDFERDLAVVNDAIKKMRGEVKNNPNNSAAREILQSSYENKVDLLKSVAARAEVVAARD